MELPPAGMYVLTVAIISILSTFLGSLLPKKWFDHDRFPYRSYPFEKDGKLYLRLKIHKWQKKVPDMSKVFPKLIPPKKLDRANAAALKVLVRETCVAEFVHTFLSLVAWVLAELMPGRGVKALKWLYILLGNVPYILIQRYNRPRLVQLLKKMESKERRVSSYEKTDPPACTAG